MCLPCRPQTGASTEAERQLVSEQWDFLCQLEMVGEEGAFVIGWEEVLTEEELSMTLKVRGALEKVISSLGGRDV